MDDPLLLTKLSPPSRAGGLVARPRLLADLDRGLPAPGETAFARRITLVSAPAGYGKTTLVADWLARLSPDRAPRVAWLSLDDDDNEPRRFLAYLLAAVGGALPGAGRSAQALLQTPQGPPLSALLSLLINDLATAEPAILVLDDYHAITSLAVHELLGHLAQHQPDRLHLVLISREDPPLPLARLRAAGAMSEVREHNLRFTRDETMAFLQDVMGLDLAPHDLGALHERTEGWAVGLQLAGLAVRGRGAATGANLSAAEFIRDFAGSHQFILDYLGDEVFSHQPPAIQEFLLKTVILDRLTAPLCDAVTNRHDSADRLRALAAANLFLQPLDAAQRWYRYHHLFAELLRHRLELRGLETTPLHRAAGRWYAANGQRRAAVKHLLTAGDWPAAARLLVRLSGEMLRAGETGTLLGWLERLPEDNLAATPGLRLEYAWTLILSGRLVDAEAQLDQIEENGAADPLLLGQIIAARVQIARSRYDVERTIALSEQALALLPADDNNARSVTALNLGIACWTAGRLARATEALVDASRWGQIGRNDYARLMAESFLALIDGATGRLRAAAERCRHILRIGGDHPATGLAHQILGALAYEADEPAAAQEHLERAVALARAIGNTELQNSALRLLALIRLGAGDPAGAAESMDQALAALQSTDVPPAARARHAVMEAQLALTRGDLAAARSWAQEAGAPGEPSAFFRWLHLLPARLALARGANEEAGALLAAEYARAADQTPPWRAGLLEICLLQALAAPDTEAALAHLGEALDRAGPEPYRRSFLDKGEPLLALLRLTLTAGGPRADRAAALLAAPSAPEATAPIEPLSARELETVALLAQNLTNAEIAAALSVSVNTVKTHLQNIYTKIGVNDRRAAVARARALGLV